MDDGSSRRLGPVVRWLATGCVLIACMVVIGGITRLTGSGLSITVWDPIMGAVPPLNEADWNVAFEQYKAIPEFTLKNQDMDLAGFKRIFFWEFLHRNWGRLMGLVFAIPFMIFWRKGLLKGWLLRRCWAILIGGGLVGALGWFMVASGLEKDPDVSHYRLAIHLCAAFAVFALVLWTVFDIRAGRMTFKGNGTAPAPWARALLVLLVVQIVWGAFTAGLDAGRIYNTWPLMNGSFMPENVRAFGDLVTDLSDHRDGVQFIHRNLAYVVALAFIVFAIVFRREASMEFVWIALLGGVVLQFVLGVLTLLTHVQLVLGVMHQMGALILLAVVLKALHRTGQRVTSMPA
ncbi:MAG TPA: COX15/CtaA family protein [Flavobacteriales bacterium]|nr:COX15/CtaA family protein [Flavobacteriales bacterium]